MGTHRRRSSWVETERRTTRRPLLVAVTGVIAAAIVATVAVVVVGVDAAPALALCDADGGHCVDASASSVAVVPLRGKRHDRLAVANQGVTGAAEVGVVAYLTSTDPARATVVDGTASTPAATVVPRGSRRTVALQGVPTSARAVLVQVGSAAAKRRAAAAGVACAGGASASPAACATAHVTFTRHHDHITRGQVVAALAAWAARSSIGVPSASATALADQVDAVPPTPAHLAARIRAGAGRLSVAWRLDAGSEDVTAVRVTRDGVAADGSGPVRIDRPASSGRLQLTGLVAGRTYTVTVAPVIGGTAGTPVSLRATPLPTTLRIAAPPRASVPPAASPSASAASATPGADSPTWPSASASAAASASADPAASGTAADSGTGIPPTPDGWRLLYAQDFSKDAALGSFDRLYPGWASYDGNTDTSRETGRPRGQVGVWNSDTTTSVADGVLDCRLWTKGRQPQVCAVTPDPNGSTGRLYGRYSVRFKADRTPGYKVAWLLWPGSNDWSQGEIDFPEGPLDGTVTGNVHRADGDPSDSAFYIDTKRSMDRWRTATIDWRPGRVTFLLDDQSWTTTDPRGLPKHPMRWALQAETQIQAQAPDPAVVGHISIDWVAGYRWAG